MALQPMPKRELIEFELKYCEKEMNRLHNQEVLDIHKVTKLEGYIQALQWVLGQEEKGWVVC